MHVHSIKYTFNQDMLQQKLSLDTRLDALQVDIVQIVRGVNDCHQPGMGHVHMQGQQWRVGQLREDSPWSRQQGTIRRESQLRFQHIPVETNKRGLFGYIMSCVVVQYLLMGTSESLLCGLRKMEMSQGVTTCRTLRRWAHFCMLGPHLPQPLQQSGHRTSSPAELAWRSLAQRTIHSPPKDPPAVNTYTQTINTQQKASFHSTQVWVASGLYNSVLGELPHLPISQKSRLPTT